MNTEEIEVLQAIFCGANEFVLKSSSPSVIFSLNLRTETECSSADFSLTFEIPRSYPTECPRVSFSSPQFDRDVADELKRRIERKCEEVKGREMVLEVAGWTRDELVPEFIDDCEKDVEEAEEQVDHRVLVLEIDHMRDRKNYVKIICKWCKELGLAGRLIFAQDRRSILLVLIGDAAGVDRYLQNHKTQVVDVDSQGRPCKERMIKVLGSVNGVDDVTNVNDVKNVDGVEDVMDGFKVVEVEKCVRVFEELGIMNVYKMFVSP